MCLVNDTCACAYVTASVREIKREGPGSEVASVIVVFANWSGQVDFGVFLPFCEP